MVFLENTTPRISLSFCAHPNHHCAVSRMWLLTNIYILLMTVPLVPRSRFLTNMETSVWFFSRTPLLVYHSFYMIIEKFITCSIICMF